MRFICIILAAALLVCAGCGDEPSPAPTAVDEVPASVRAIIDRRCVDCHGPYAPGHGDLSSDAVLIDGRLAIADAVASGRMPRWMPTPGCGSFADARILTPAERDLLLDWASGRSVAGRTAESPPRVMQFPDRAPDQTLTMEGPFVMQPSDRLDLNACHALTSRPDHDLFIEAVRFRPNRPDLIHHLGLIAIPPEQFRHIGPVDNPQIFCAEDAALPIASTLQLSRPVSYPAGIAARIPAGWVPALSVHYSEAFAPAGEQQAEVTFEVDLWYAEPTAVTDFTVENFGVPDIHVPAGEPSVTVTGEHLITSDRLAVAVAPHMHLFGRSYHAELVRSTGEVECLVDVADWQFTEQEFYFFDPAAPLQLRAGDRLRFRCEYDNSAAGQPVIQGRVGDPQDLNIGWTARDEMCNLTFLEVGQRSP